MANQIGSYVHNASGWFATQTLKEGLLVLIAIVMASVMILHLMAILKAVSWCIALCFLSTAALQIETYGLALFVFIMTYFSSA